MPKTYRIVTAGLLLAVFVVAGFASAEQSLVFQGLKHTAVGMATLRLDGGALVVTTMDPRGRDGVAVALGDATSWTERSRMTAHRALPLMVSWDAMADNVRISSLRMQRTGAFFAFSASFTGGTTVAYSAQVYNDGRLVGAVGGVPTSAHIDVPIAFCATFSEILDCGGREFYNTANGECAWRMSWGPKVPIQLPNGTVVTGNELRMVEEVRPAGHYPYLTFDAIVMRSNAQSISLLSETVR